jgi:hypothetical protein
MHNNSLFKFLLVLVGILLFVSCDKEYSAVGDALIGDNNFELVKYPANVVAYNEKITPIESNNLPVNALGIYDNPAFGKTTAGFATQLTLAIVKPTFGANISIESVYLDIPYFVDATQTKPIASTTTGVTAGNTYVLDSIYGEPNAKIKLSVYESGRYMGNQDGKSQTFYTNQNAEFDSFKIGNRLNDDLDKSQNDEFFFNPAQNSVSTTNATNVVTISYSPPGMRLKLNTAFFKDKIFNAPAGSLASNDVFINYFKGLYFKVEQSGSDKGSLAMINFLKGTITIKYKEDSTTTPVAPVEKSIVLNMSGSTASLLEQSNTKAEYETARSNPNRVLGDKKLYLKGGEGSVAVLDIFEKKDLIGYDTNGSLTGPNGVSDELDKIRKEGWLINDANLLFNIDTENAEFKNSFEPQRIYLYNFTNNATILDYALGAATTNKNTTKFLFGGYIKKDATSKRGVSYKINITNHIRNLVKNAAAINIKLGVAVTEDMNISDFKKLSTTNDFISQAPRASVMNPLGTILYGNNLPDTDSNYSKRVQLEIYYTKPK